MACLVAVVALAILTAKAKWLRSQYYKRIFCQVPDTYSLLGGLELLLGSYDFDFLLHSIYGIRFVVILTDVDLEATVILSIEVLLCILGVKFILVLNEGVGALLSKRTKGMR